MEYRKKVKISNKLGFHLRVVSMFVTEADKFKSDIKIKYDENDIDGKSIMSVMSLGLPYGTEIEIIADGPDSKEAMAKLLKLFENKFGEE